VAAGQISGPYGHQNLTVFLVHSSRQDGRDFLTLDEGLANGLVKVTEKEQEQVGKLLIDNQSDRPLFLQEGERLQGGKQDRTIIASMVVPPHSGRITLPAFCVEQGRWAPAGNGLAFTRPASLALAPKGVRAAAKVEGSQSHVWRAISVQKESASARLNALNTNSSVNETFDSPGVQKVSDDCARALGSVPDRHPDSVGVVLVVNGRFEEANVYPNHALLKKLFPRLVQAYAVQAALLKDEPREAGTLSPADIARLLKEGGERSRHDNPIDGRNTLHVCELEGDRFQCTTEYEGGVVHVQLLKKNGNPAAGGSSARGAVLGDNW
jgi:hypothetical protein